MGELKMKQMEIKAGAALDWAVAEAIGWQFKCRPKNGMSRFDEIAGTNLEGWWDGDRYVSYEAPCFSTDLNAAFAAAERAGLFHQDTDAFLCRTPYGKRGSEEEWKVWCEQGEKLRFECSYHGSTPALAICAAILALKGYSND